MYRIMIIILLSFGVMFAHTTKLDEIGQNVLVAGDKVDVSRCDKFNWCKVKGKDLYIRRQFFKKIGKRTLQMKRSKRFSHTHFYKKTDKKGDMFNTYQKAMITKACGSGDAKKCEQVKQSFIAQNKKDTNDTKEHEVIESHKDAYEIYEEQTNKAPNFFLYGGLGVAVFTIKDEIENENTVLIADTDDDDAVVLEIGAGYNFTKNWFATIEASRTAALKRADVTDILLTGNYRFSTKTFSKPYIGIAVGVSSLVWNKQPVVVGEMRKTNNRMVAGVQVGSDFIIRDNWSWYSKLQVLLKNHTTDIHGENYIHQIQTNLTLGVKYDF